MTLHFSDLIFWYSNGPGNPTTAAQGIGYVQELLARLTNVTLPKGDTNTNNTLDDNTTTFPLRQPIYFDFTHDTVIAASTFQIRVTSRVLRMLTIICSRHCYEPDEFQSRWSLADDVYSEWPGKQARACSHATT